MEEIPIKFVIFILIMLNSFTQCKITTIYVTEGDTAILNFTYSCNSKEITLQRGNGAPFYNSRSQVPPASSNLKLRNETNGEICFLYLTINPVSRNDQGGYILFAYKNDPTQIDEDRILLLTASPPGEASCALSEKYIHEDWFMLHCTADLGSIQGLITCYQDGIKIPPLNSPQQHDKTLSQTLLAKLGSLVYCCSSTLDRTKDRCDCKDSVWDPNQNKQVTNITDPCPYTVPSPSTKATMIISQQPNSSRGLLRLQVVIGFLILAFVASITGTVCYFKRHSKKSAISNMEERLALCEESLMLIDTINVPDQITSPAIAGCIDEYNVIIMDAASSQRDTYILDMNTKDTRRVITSSDTSRVQSCALLSDDQVVCGKSNRSCTGDSLTGCICVYDRQWNLINDVTIPGNTTKDFNIVDVAVNQDGMIIAVEYGESKIYVINPANGKIVNTITCKQNISLCGVLSSGHIITQPCPQDHRVFIINRKGIKRKITHSDKIWNVSIDPLTDEIYVVTSDDEYKTCVIEQLVSGSHTKKRRAASFPLSTRIMEENRRPHLASSSVKMTSSGTTIACDGANILIFKKMFSL